MKDKVYTFELSIDWKLLELVSNIEKYDATWGNLEKKESVRLKGLRTIATISSVGASTRIEGSKMTNSEVEELLNNLDITKTEDRDSQEVVGYFNALDLIIESFEEIRISEGDIKNLHNLLLKISEKDNWHKGDYKQLTNAVEANFPDGSKQIIFKTSEPGYETENAIRKLIEWYNKDSEVNQLIKIGSFVYDFLSIHPFQDGNGRMSRLLTTLLMLKSGYNWIQFVSLEHEIENNKKEYYKSLRSCQAQRPNEEITEWMLFFLKSLINVQSKLKHKIEISGIETELTNRERMIYNFIIDHPGSKSGQISEELNIPNPTTKRLLSKLVNMELVTKLGKGAGTSYEVK